MLIRCNKEILGYRFTFTTYKTFNLVMHNSICYEIVTYVILIHYLMWYDSYEAKCYSIRILHSCKVFKYNINFIFILTVSRGLPYSQIL